MVMSKKAWKTFLLLLCKCLVVERAGNAAAPHSIQDTTGGRDRVVRKALQVASLAIPLLSMANENEAISIKV